MNAVMRMLGGPAVMLALVTAGLAAGALREIQLTDGSVLTGEVLSLSNGSYTIRTDAMGTITVPDSRVRSIRSKNAGAGPSDSGSQLGSVQQRLMADQDILSLILSLKDDPAVQEILNDPEIMHAVNTGDHASLAANPRFQKFMNNPTVRDIRNRAVQ